MPICATKGCTRPADEHRKTCDYHLQMFARSKAKARAAKPPGVCIGHGCKNETRPGLKTCDACLAYQIEYKRKNAQKAKDMNARMGIRLRALTIEAYGGRCARCGESDPIVLQLDHINGRTAGDRWTGQEAMRRLRDLGFPQGDHQLLCANCHVRKTYDDLGLRSNDNELLASRIWKKRLVD